MLKGQIMNAEWPFDQAPNVTAITTRQVLEDNLPILRVVHYSDDHSWAFTCGTTNDPNDGKVVFLEDALKLDPSIATIADLPPGCGAWREKVGDSWNRYQNDDF